MVIGNHNIEEGVRLKAHIGPLRNEITMQHTSVSEIGAKLQVPRLQRPKGLGYIYRSDLVHPNCEPVGATVLWLDRVTTGLSVRRQALAQTWRCYSDIANNEAAPRA